MVSTPAMNANRPASSESVLRSDLWSPSSGSVETCGTALGRQPVLAYCLVVYAAIRTNSRVWLIAWAMVPTLPSLQTAISGLLPMVRAIILQTTVSGLLLNGCGVKVELWLTSRICSLRWFRTLLPQFLQGSVRVLELTCSQIDPESRVRRDLSVTKVAVSTS